MSNNEYSRKIPGDRDLKAINDSIAWEEAGASEFIKSELDSNQQNNIGTFRVASTIPKTLIIVKKGDPQPPKTIPNPVWSGKMVVQGKLTDVVAYREA